MAAESLHHNDAETAHQVELPPLGVSLSSDIQFREGRPHPYSPRVRWVDPGTDKRRSRSVSTETLEQAEDWIKGMESAARGGVDPETASMTLVEYGTSVMDLALRGLERKTLDPYLAGWRKRVIPALGHLPVRAVTTGAVDRSVRGWVAEGTGRSAVKNSLAILGRVMEQAVRDEIIERNPAKISGWQRQYERPEDELDDPRSLALPDWGTLTRLGAALVERSRDKYQGWGDVVIFASCTAARIGEVSGVRAKDINTDRWVWTVRRQTTTSPGGLIDKGTKGKRARQVPIIEEVRPLVLSKLEAVKYEPDARLFTGPRGGRLTTKTVRNATHWDEVVSELGYEHLRRHDLRHTGLTWMADAGVPMHVLQKIAGHGSITTTQRYLHPDGQTVTAAGKALSAHLAAEPWSVDSPVGPE